MSLIRPKSMVLTFIIELVFIGFVTLLIVSLWAFYVSIKPPKWNPSVTPRDYEMAYESVRFQSADDISLAGWFIPAQSASTKTIIMMHGYPASKSDIVDLGVFLHDEYNLFLFDFRFLGESAGSYTTAGAKEVQDLEGALDYLKVYKPDQTKAIGVWGFSLGGAVGIMGAAKHPEIKAIVADSSYANLDLMVYGLYSRFGFLRTPFVYMTRKWAKLFLGIDTKEVSPEHSVTKTNTALLLIHGEQDREIPLENSQRIFANAAGPKGLWIIEGASHGMAYALEKAQYERRVLQFFAEYLKE